MLIPARNNKNRYQQQPNKLARMKKINCILLVDDDHATNYLNKVIVSRLGIAKHVFEVADGQEALDFILQEGIFANKSKDYPAPDLIILDVNMTIIDGFEFLDKYHKLPSKVQTAKIILLSTSDRKTDLQRARKYPRVVDYIVKPVKRETWFNILKRI